MFITIDLGWTFPGNMFCEASFLYSNAKAINIACQIPVVPGWTFLLTPFMRNWRTQCYLMKQKCEGFWNGISLVLFWYCNRSKLLRWRAEERKNQGYSLGRFGRRCFPDCRPAVVGPVDVLRAQVDVLDSSGIGHKPSPAVARPFSDETAVDVGHDNEVRTEWQSGADHVGCVEVHSDWSIGAGFESNSLKELLCGVHDCFVWNRTWKMETTPVSHGRDSKVTPGKLVEASCPLQL